ncbi:ZIP family metal transporter [Luteolibacter sp. AS25]|uniref:ZIP family metal transporter n=1 Tax=Luteolibacter sp. AS25 TaxID=3135776 RepID=UPI00398A984C
MSNLPEWIIIVLLSLGAGLSMPIGAIIARFENIHSDWLENEVRHGVIAFGGGALLSAVALVLIPEGIRSNSIPVTILCFGGGGLAFAWLDSMLAKSKSKAGQLVAMLSDFIPEALALGTTFMASPSVAVLLASLIALQNLPEGFNAFRELQQNNSSKPWHLIGVFTLMALLGPLSALTGHFFLREQHSLVGATQLFAAGGILYLVIEDIAPQAKLSNSRRPALGAVAGFLLGLIGHMLTK